MTDYSSEERARVVRDIARWKVELVEVGGGREYPFEELQEFISDLLDMSGEELDEFWVGTVGEWVCSRHDVDLGDDPEAFLDGQLSKVANGDETDYGFVVDVELPRPDSE